MCEGVEVISRKSESPEDGKHEIRNKKSGSLHVLVALAPTSIFHGSLFTL